MSAIIATMTQASIQKVVDAHLVGDIMQIPPMVSALRVDGKRLHELAREGIEVAREPRPVTVHAFDVLAVRENMIDVRVECSSGTYIRTLAADLGRLLGGGAHLRDLRRTSIGSFGIDIAIPLAAFEALDRDDARTALRPVLDTCRSLSRVSVSDDQRRAVAAGAVLPRSTFSGEPPWAVVHEEASGVVELLAVYEPFSNERVGSDMARPIVVLAAPPSQPTTS
jgi:tRNA pseudouridine55 synthase